MEDLLVKLQSQDSEISITLTIINFAFCVLFSLILKEIFLKYSNVSFNRSSIARNLVTLSCIVFVVIVIVKNSLALSLGLVGALSIVRFRTPIKEPTELIYLFFSIALGLGFGSSQTLITSILAILLFVYIYFTSSKDFDGSKLEDFNLIIEWNDKNLDIGKINQTIKVYNEIVSVEKISFEKNKMVAMFNLHINSEEKLFELIHEVKKMKIESVDYFKVPKVF
tara:strand:- start:2248 stop:2919 length:672 start_codon:yes stop_codon:yes gene_type:complete